VIHLVSQTASIPSIQIHPILTNNN